MTTIALPQLKGHDRLTNSRLAAFKTCPRMHWFRYQVGLRRHQGKAPLRMGSAYHLGLDLLAQGKELAETLELALAGYTEVPAWASTDEGTYEWKIERITVAHMIAGHHWRWGAAPTTVLGTEESFSVPIRNPATGAMTPLFRQDGKIDRRVMLDDGRMAIEENKTTSEDLAPDSIYWTRLRRDHQISSYMHGARVLGHDIQTVIYDVIRKPTIRPTMIPLRDGPDGTTGLKIVMDANGERVRTKDGKKWRETPDADLGFVALTRQETPEEFGQRYGNAMRAEPDKYFARREIPRLDADLELFQQELWDQVQQLRACQTHGRWYRNTAACIQWGSPCEYHDICDTYEFDPNHVPEGFVTVDDLHPELV